MPARTQLPRTLLLAALLAPLGVFAQENAPKPPASPEEAPEAAEAVELPSVAEPEELASVAELAERWQAAWRDRPVLVAAPEDPAEVPDAQNRGEHIRFTLTQVNRSSLSNRAWRAFWEQQQDLAGALANRLRAGGTPPDLADVEAWTALAAAKVESQDVLLEALQDRRAAIEAELKLPPPQTATPAESLGEDSGPYRRRTARIDGLKRSIAAQTRKGGEDGDVLAYLELQDASELALIEAVRRDTDLADQELAIAKAGADRRPRSELTPIWKEIATEAVLKTRRIAGDLAQRELDRRNRELEVSLLTAERQLRATRLAELEASLAHERSFSSLADATRQSAQLWLRHKAPLVGLRLVLIVLAAFLALLFVRRVSGALVARADSRAPDDLAGKKRRETLVDVFSSLIRLLVWGTAGLVALSELGVNTRPILGSFAILGLAISFGSQNLVKDMVNGFFVLLENQYAVGDTVEIGGKQGTVERITLRTTWLRSGLTGIVYTIANGDVSGVANHTRDWSGVAVEVGVGYDADLEHVRDVVNAVGQEFADDPEWSERVLAAPVSQGVIRLDDSAVVVRVAGKVTPGAQWAADRELKGRLKKRLDAEGIEIPFPQQVLHTLAPPPAGPKG